MSIFMNRILTTEEYEELHVNILEESTKYERKYQCPFCDVRDTRENLVHHINEEHEEMIPRGYTAARIVFNTINKKTDGKCMVCSAKTLWNETAWRYQSLCSDRCRKVYKDEIIDKRMINKYGKSTLLNDPEHQKKMLSGRKISGSYKFSDGGVRTYTGTYELNLLEFMDKVLNIPSIDIETPGPIYEYEFKGQKLVWITDIFYIPFNLVFDVKDGGTNKNTHPNMKDYRDKQIAKEKAITEARKHNYIRLTDNNFEQLLYIMAEIKKEMLDQKDSKLETVVHINEAMVGGIHSEPLGPVVYLLPYSRNNVGIEGIGMIKNLLMDNIFVQNPELGTIDIKGKEFFKEYYYSIIEVPIDKISYIKILQDIKESKEIWDLDYFNKAITEQSSNGLEDIFINESYKLIHSGYDLTKFDVEEELKNISENRIDQIISTVYELFGHSTGIYECGIHSLDKSNKASELLKDYPSLVVKENHNGCFIKNIVNGKTSNYFEDFKQVPEYLLKLLSL